MQEDARREVELALKVAVAVERGLRHEVIAARLGVTRCEVTAATARLKRVRERVERWSSGRPRALCREICREPRSSGVTERT
jgi:hypothetical protein